MVSKSGWGVSRRAWRGEVEIRCGRKERKKKGDGRCRGHGTGKGGG